MIVVAVATQTSTAAVAAFHDGPQLAPFHVGGCGCRSCTTGAVAVATDDGFTGIRLATVVCHGAAVVVVALGDEARAGFTLLLFAAVAMVVAIVLLVGGGDRG